MMPVPPALMKAFEDRAVIPSPELCRLLSIDYDTLRRHIANGRIGFVNIGAGDVAPRKGFTLGEVMRFLEGQSRRVEPEGRARRSAGGAAVGGDSGIREILAKVIAGKAAGGGFSARREVAASPKPRRARVSRKAV